MFRKVTYFEVRDREEVIRLLLQYAGIDFEDVQISSEDWPRLKSTTPFEQLPIFEEYGRVSYQTKAIARYLAKRCKLVGKTDWENLELDALVDTISDLHEKMSECALEQDTVRKEQLQTTLVNDTIPFYLDRFEERAEKNFGFLALRRLTWADFFFASTIGFMNGVVEMNLLQERPNAQNVVSNVIELVKLKEWIRTKPNLPME